MLTAPMCVKGRSWEQFFLFSPFSSSHDEWLNNSALHTIRWRPTPQQRSITWSVRVSPSRIQFSTEELFKCQVWRRIFISTSLREYQSNVNSEFDHILIWELRLSEPKRNKEKINTSHSALSPGSLCKWYQMKIQSNTFALQRQHLKTRWKLHFACFIHRNIAFLREHAIERSTSRCVQPAKFFGAVHCEQFHWSTKKSAETQHHSSIA